MIYSILADSVELQNIVYNSDLRQIISCLTLADSNKKEFINNLTATNIVDVVSAQRSNLTTFNDINARLQFYLKIIKTNLLLKNPFYDKENYSTAIAITALDQFIKTSGENFALVEKSCPKTINIIGGHIASVSSGAVQQYCCAHQGSIKFSQCEVPVKKQPTETTDKLFQLLKFADIPDIDMFISNSNTTKIAASSIVEKLRLFMSVLSNITAFYGKMVYIHTSFSGGIRTNSMEFSILVKKDLETIEYYGEGKKRVLKKSYVVVGPYVKTKIGHDKDTRTHSHRLTNINSGSMSQLDAKEDKSDNVEIANAITVDSKNVFYLPSLVYNFQSLNQNLVETFNVAEDEGSNGQFRAFYSLQNANNFDLNSVIDLDSFFDIKQGNIISKENILLAIDYIFITWLKNLQYTYCTLYTCHNNCHANSFEQTSTISKEVQITIKCYITGGTIHIDSDVENTFEICTVGLGNTTVQLKPTIIEARKAAYTSDTPKSFSLDSVADPAISVTSNGVVTIGPTVTAKSIIVNAYFDTRTVNLILHADNDVVDGTFPNNAETVTLTVPALNTDRNNSLTILSADTDRIPTTLTMKCVGWSSLANNSRYTKTQLSNYTDDEDFYPIYSLTGYTVTFNGSNDEVAGKVLSGNEEYDEVQVVVGKGGKISTFPTAEPTEDGYTESNSWYTKSTNKTTNNTQYTTSTAINKDITLYPIYTAASTT